MYKEEEPSDIWAFGAQTHGQLGLGDRRRKGVSSPKYIPFFTGKNIKQVCAGKLHSAFVTSSGVLYTVGDGAFGRLGHGGKASSSEPKSLAVLNSCSVVQVHVCRDHTICLSDDGDVWTWGNKLLGRLGRCSVMATHPGLVPRLSNNKMVACGGANSAIITNDNSIWTFGYNAVGQLGLGLKDEYIDRATRIESLKGKVLTVSVGDRHTAIVTLSGEVYTWGNNEYGQLGIGNKKNSNVPVLAKILPSSSASSSSSYGLAKTVSCGSNHTAVLTHEHQVFTCGRGNTGSLGHGDRNDKTTFKRVDTLVDKKVIQISCGFGCKAHTLALMDNGDLWSWGFDKYGQLGHGTELTLDEDIEDTTSGITRPKMIEGIRGVHSVSAGRYYTLAIIKGTNNILLQHAREGASISCINALIDSTSQQQGQGKGKERVKELLACVDIDGHTPLHLAVKWNHSKVAKALIDLGANVLARTKNISIRTPLHLAVLNNNYTCVNVLTSTSVRLKDRKTAINLQDYNGQTPLHIALSIGNHKIGEFLTKRGGDVNKITDKYSKTALDYCTFEEAFRYKVLADVSDICIVCVGLDASFSKSLLQDVEAFNIKCCTFIPTKEDHSSSNTFANIISGCRGIVFVVTPDSVKNEACMNALKLAKKTETMVYPVVHRETTITDELESLLYRRQLVDFTKVESNQEGVAQLVAGLRNAFESKSTGKKNERKMKEKQNKEEEEYNKEEIVEKEEDAERKQLSDTRKLKRSARNLVKTIKEQKDAPLFLCYSNSDRTIAEEVYKGITQEGIHCCEFKACHMGSTTASKQISQSWGLLLLVSDASLRTGAIRDQIALAENKGRRIFPVFLSKYTKLDAAMQYTLSRSPRFYYNTHSHSSSSSSSRREDDLAVLVYTIKLGSAVYKRSTKSQQLAKLAKTIEKDIDDKEEALVKVRVFAKQEDTRK